MGKSTKMRISIILSVLLIFQCFTAFAAEQNNSTEYDLQTAIDTAIKNSNYLKLSDEKIKNASDSYYYYWNLAISVANNTISRKQYETDYDLIEYKKQELLYPKQKLNDLNNLKYDKQNKIIDIKLDVTEKYFSLLSIDKKITYQQGLLDRLQAELKVKKNDVKIGKSTNNAVTEVELKIRQADNKMVQLNREKEKMTMTLNALLGRPISDQIKIKEMDIPQIEYVISDIEAIIADRQKNSASIKSINFDIQCAKLEVEIIKGITKREDPIELDTLEITQLTQEYALLDEMSNIEKYIRQENNSILNLKDEIQIKKLNNEICHKNLEVEQQKLKLGLVSQADINSAINASEQAGIDYLQAQLNYYLEVVRFNAYMEKQ